MPPTIRLQQGARILLNYLHLAKLILQLAVCPKWDQNSNNELNRDAFKVDPNVIKEYSHLEQIASQPLPIS
ncbi:unnamed protein product [Rhizophagus irregularis]|nr:unnamed protein product [Rhizophagus irregularis]